MANEWILGQPVQTDETNEEWILGQPHIVIDDTVSEDIVVLRRRREG